MLSYRSARRQAGGLLGWLKKFRWQVYKSLLQRRDGVPKIVAARRERSGEHRIFDPRRIEYPGLLLFGRDVAAKDLNDTVDVSNQCPRSQGFP
jgi:hypothetical protein